MFVSSLVSFSGNEGQRHHAKERRGDRQRRDNDDRRRIKDADDDARAGIAVQRHQTGPARLHCGERGLGLYFVVTRAGSKLWTLRYKKPGDGRATEASVRQIPLAGIGRCAVEGEDMARDVALNKDPIEQKRAKREKAREAKQTFRAAFDAYRHATERRDLAATARLVERCERHAASLMASRCIPSTPEPSRRPWPPFTAAPSRRQEEPWPGSPGYSTGRRSWGCAPATLRRRSRAISNIYGDRRSRPFICERCRMTTCPTFTRSCAISTTCRGLGACGS